ncbi:MAG: ATP-binding cassette domain-containing protein [Clostridiales bacterium]|nr:ATP-binding cassette domain-containing protein [Clostridiales bacterium]
MGTALLSVNDVHAALESGKEILSGLSLEIRAGETHVILGPNGAGKSTLAHVVMGHPADRVTRGELIFEGEAITRARTDERARRGIFMSFQPPEEVDGITVEHFLRTAKTAVTGAPLKVFAFRKELQQAMKALEIDTDYP